MAAVAVAVPPTQPRVAPGKFDAESLLGDGPAKGGIRIRLLGVDAALSPSLLDVHPSPKPELAGLVDREEYDVDGDNVLSWSEYVPYLQDVSLRYRAEFGKTSPGKRRCVMWLRSMVILLLYMLW